MAGPNERDALRIPDEGRARQMAISLLRAGAWASLTAETLELVTAGGKQSDISAGAIA